MWSSQDVVEILWPRFVGRFKWRGTQPGKMTVAARSIVEGIDVVHHVGYSQLAVLVDLFLDPLFFRLLKKDSATALSQQLPFRLMLGSRRFERQNRRQASLPYCVP